MLLPQVLLWLLVLLGVGIAARGFFVEPPEARKYFRFAAVTIVGLSAWQLLAFDGSPLVWLARGLFGAWLVIVMFLGWRSGVSAYRLLIGAALATIVGLLALLWLPGDGISTVMRQAAVVFVIVSTVAFIASMLNVAMRIGRLRRRQTEH